MSHSYEVIRLIRQDLGCHIIMDRVEGEILGEYILRYPYIEKSKLFAWIYQLIKQLESIEKVKGISEYRFLTPFYIVLKADQTIALLNLKAKANYKYMDRLSANSIVKWFYPTNGTYNDIYSFGKTLQFLLAKSNLTPQLTKQEELKLQSIISKCLTDKSRRQYHSFSEIASDFSTNSKNNKKRSIMLFGVIVILLCLGMWRKQENDGYLDLGIAYFYILGDYKKSQEMFEEIEGSQVASAYQSLCSYMLGDSNYSDVEMEGILRGLCDTLGEDFGLEDKCCFIRVYSSIDSESARRQVIELGEQVLQETGWSANQDVIREIVANSYLKEGEYEKALSKYEDILKSRHGEEIYKALLELYEKSGRTKDALEACVEGMKWNQDSVEIPLCYIRLICQNQTLTKEEKESTITEVIQNYAIIRKEQRFKVLQAEYGIEVEGGKVWLEE